MEKKMYATPCTEVIEIEGKQNILEGSIVAGQYDGNFRTNQRVDFDIWAEE